MSEATIDRQSTFTIKELESISQRVRDGDEKAMKFIMIDNKVYDVTEFVEDHPGGAQVLLTHIGKDASDVFHAMHPESAYEILNNYYVGDIQSTVPTETSASAQFAIEMRTLRDKLKKDGYFHSSKLFYAYKVISTLAICVAGLSLLYAYGRSSTLAVVASAIVVGIFWQQCGWLAHDFGHHQCFEDRSFNDILVIFLGNFCQGFSLSWWKNKHNTHHASTNVHGQDPDIDTAPVLLWDEYASAAYYASLDQEPTMISRFLAEQVLPHQNRYFFFILAFARLSWALQSLSYSFKKESINKSRQLNLFERACLIGHWSLFGFCIYSWCSNFYHMILFFLISQATTGYTLALVFALNHNGMPVITEEKAETMEFFEIQVITGRDVSLSPLGDWFMGGLNYQIEHHVFPNMPRHNLSKVKPMVKSLCQKYDINYHDTGFLKGTLEVLQTLDITSKLSLQLTVPDVIAHRGFSAENPENSLLSFQNAIKAGATALEGDIRLSKDNEIIIMHDMSLSRTTSGSGNIRDHDWYGDIDRLHLKADKDSPVPRLKDVVELVIQPTTNKEIYMVIDIKYDNDLKILDALKTLLDAFQHYADLSKRFVIAIWNMEFFKRTKELFPDYKTCFIGLSLSAASNFMETVDCFNLPFAALVDSEGQTFIKQAHERKKRVFAWTINDTQQMKTCVVKGVDGVLGDNVPLLLEHVHHQPKKITSAEEYQQFVDSDTYLCSKRTRLYFYLLKKGMSLASSAVIGL